MARGQYDPGENRLRNAQVAERRSRSRAGGDRLSGTWVGDWGPSPSDRNQVTVELKWDGKALSGTVNPGPNTVPLQKASFDPKAKTVHFETQTKGRRVQELHYKVDGKLDKNTLSGTWNHESRKGDFKITRK